jgi:peptidoglycan/LPS O-acetylase OafA/YrhL
MPPDSGAPSVKQLEFLPRIEALRGVAALAVVGQHVSGPLAELPAASWLDGLASRLIGALSNGTGAVVTFFVLSGFVLARSLDANPDPVRFFRSRVFRLFPAAMAVVTLLTVLHWQFGFFVAREASFDPLDILLNLLMIRSDINTVMWSLTVEWVATPLIWLSAWWFRRHGEPLLWCLIIFLFALSFLGPYVNLLGGAANLAPLYAFMVGVLVHFGRVRIVSQFSSRLATAIAIVAVAAYIFCGASKQTAPILALECASAATVIALIVHRPAMTLFEPLDLGLVRFYGRISYSFYLLHLIGISVALRILDPVMLNAWGVPSSLTIAVTTLGAIVCTTPAAWLTYRLIERPAIRLGRTLGRQSGLLTAT